MEPTVIRVRANQKIAIPVIKFVSIDVMNNFTTFQFSSKHLFCN